MLALKYTLAWCEHRKVTTEVIMLVLTRKSGEVVTIGDSIRVVILSVEGRRVKLGITAPPELPIHREETQQRLNGTAERPWMFRPLEVAR